MTSTPVFTLRAVETYEQREQDQDWRQRVATERAARVAAYDRVVEIRRLKSRMLVFLFAVLLVLACVILFAKPSKVSPMVGDSAPVQSGDCATLPGPSNSTR